MLHSLKGVKGVKVDLKGAAAYVAMDSKVQAGAKQIAEAFNGLNDGRHQFRATATDAKNVRLNVTGMTKDKDEAAVSKSLGKVKGVKAAFADARVGSAVVFVGKETEPEKLIVAVARAGSFKATVKAEEEKKKE